MAKKETKKDEDRGMRIDAKSADDVIYRDLVKFGETLMRDAKKAGICPKRLVERLSVNVHLFMSALIEGVRDIDRRAAKPAARAKKAKA